MIGRLIDRSVSTLQGANSETDTKFQLCLYFLLQMFANALVLYAGFKLIKFRHLSFDDWMGSTFQGVLFVTMCFSVQDNFYANARLII